MKTKGKLLKFESLGPSFFQYYEIKNMVNELILFAEGTNVSIRCRAISYYCVLATTPGKERGFPERRERIIEGLPT